MTLVRYNPNREILTLRDMMDRLFEDMDANNGGSRLARLPIDAYSTENDIVINASLPGATADDVTITVEGESLTIRGHIGGRVENVNYLFSERFVGEFSRTLQLNVPIDQENIEASFENGILTLVLPKAEEVRPKVIKVQAR